MKIVNSQKRVSMIRIIVFQLIDGSKTQLYLMITYKIKQVKQIITQIITTMMIRARSKPKMRNPICFTKKVVEDKYKKYPKQYTKRNQEQQNMLNITKLSMTSAQSKKKVKPNGDAQLSRQPSPISIRNSKNQATDDNFIEKLFNKNYNSNSTNKQKNLFVEKLIQGLVTGQNTLSMSKEHTYSHIDYIDFIKQIHLKNQQIASLHNQINELKLNISNFTLLVFDLTVLCRKRNSKIVIQSENMDINRKTDEVIAYLDSLIKRWKMQEKFKSHCDDISKKNLLTSIPKGQYKRKCYTQSLKIPIQQYLESLQNIKLQEHDHNFTSFKKSEDQLDKQSEELMKIISRRSSAGVKDDEEIYIAIRPFEPKNQYQLNLKVGDKVSILQKSDSSRWVGFKDGKVGYFPHECLF